MTDTITTEPSRQQAVAEVRSTRCPQGVSKQRWRSIQKLLRVVAKHYPKAYPSVATLAAEMKCSHRMAQYRIQWAVECGVLAVEYDGGENWQKKTGTVGTQRNATTINKTSRYHIASLKPDCRGARSDDDIAHRSTPSEYQLPSVVGTHSGSPRYARPQSERVANDAEEIVRDGEARVAEKYGRLRTERPVFQTKVRKNDAVVLVEYFLVEWENLLAKKPLLASNNAIDRKGESQGYLWNQLLRPEYGVAYTSAQVLEMIDAFFLDLASGRIGLKPRQSAWKAFTVHKQPPKVKTDHKAKREALRARNK